MNASISIGKNFIQLRETGSTNDYALQLLNAYNPPEGTIVSTFHQKKGKGYQNNVWISEKDKNLSFSIILKPAFLKASEQFRLNQWLCVSLVKKLRFLFGLKLQIKWPNDLFLDGKKLGGVLIQNSVSGNHLKHSVLGVGINVNQSDFPDDIPLAYSLINAGVDGLVLTDLLSELVLELNSKYSLVSMKQWSVLNEAYHSFLLGWKEKRSFKNLIDGNEDSFEGEVLGVDEFGRLQLKVERELRLFNFKELEWE